MELGSFRYWGCREVGVGKTVFARGLIRSLCDSDTMQVSSPTFLLDNVFETAAGTV